MWCDCLLFGQLTKVSFSIFQSFSVGLTRYISNCNLPSTYQPFYLPAYIFTSLFTYLTTNLATYILTTYLPTVPHTYLAPWLSPWLYVSQLVCLLAWLTGPKMTEKVTLLSEKQVITPHQIPPHPKILCPTSWPVVLPPSATCFLLFGPFRSFSVLFGPFSVPFRFFSVFIPIPHSEC